MIEIILLWAILTFCMLYTLWFFGSRDHNERDFINTIFFLNLIIVFFSFVSCYIDPDFNNDRLIINLMSLNIIINAFIIKYRHNINYYHNNYGYNTI